MANQSILCKFNVANAPTSQIYLRRKELSLVGLNSNNMYFVRVTCGYGADESGEPLSRCDDSLLLSFSLLSRVMSELISQ
jgi:hypothetical protein